MDEMPVYLTPVQLAARIHRRPSTLAKWRMRDVGPAYVQPNASGTVLYPLADVEAWERQFRVEPGSRDPDGRRRRAERTRAATEARRRNS